MEKSSTIEWEYDKVYNLAIPKEYVLYMERLAHCVSKIKAPL